MMTTAVNIGFRKNDKLNCPISFQIRGLAKYMLYRVPKNSQWPICKVAWYSKTVQKQEKIDLHWNKTKRL